MINGDSSSIMIVRYEWDVTYFRIAKAEFAGIFLFNIIWDIVKANYYCSNFSK